MIDNRTWWRNRASVRLLGAPVAVVALLGLAACGTSTDTGTSAAAASASAEAPADDAATPDGTALAAYQPGRLTALGVWWPGA
jgi:ABC-type phosphate transport system substrate-binding protein